MPTPELHRMGFNITYAIWWVVKTLFARVALVGLKTENVEKLFCLFAHDILDVGSSFCGVSEYNF